MASPLRYGSSMLALPKKWPGSRRCPPLPSLTGAVLPIVTWPARPDRVVQNRTSQSRAMVFLTSRVASTGVIKEDVESRLRWANFSAHGHGTFNISPKRKLFSSWIAITWKFDISLKVLAYFATEGGEAGEIDR